MEGNTERDHGGETLGLIALVRENGRRKPPQILKNLPDPIQRKLFKQFSQRHDSEVRRVYRSSPAVLVNSARVMDANPRKARHVFCQKDRYPIEFNRVRDY